MIIGTLEKGYELTGAVVNLAAVGVANAVAIYQVSNFAQQLGTKSFKLKKLLIHDNGTGGTQVHIGTGVAGTFVARLPGIQTVSNMDIEITEDQLSDYEFFVDCTAYPDAIGGSTIDIQAVVEEIG